MNVVALDPGASITMHAGASTDSIRDSFSLRSKGLLYDARKLQLSNDRVISLFITTGFLSLLTRNRSKVYASLLSVPGLRCLLPGPISGP